MKGRNMDALTEQHLLTVLRTILDDYKHLCPDDNGNVDDMRTRLIRSAELAIHATKQPKQHPLVRACNQFMIHAQDFTRHNKHYVGALRKYTDAIETALDDIEGNI